MPIPHEITMLESRTKSSNRWAFVVEDPEHEHYQFLLNDQFNYVFYTTVTGKKKVLTGILWTKKTFRYRGIRKFSFDVPGFSWFIPVLPSVDYLILVSKKGPCIEIGYRPMNFPNPMDKKLPKAHYRI